MRRGATGSGVDLALFVAAQLVFGAVAVNWGAYHPRAVALLAAALAGIVVHFVRPPRLPPLAIVAALLVDALLLVGDATLIRSRPLDSVLVRVALAAQVLALLGYLPALVTLAPEPRGLRHARFAVFAIAVAVSGAATYRAAPAPAIDVFYFQQQAAADLAAGRDPYVTTRVPSTGPRGWGPKTAPYVYPPAQLYLTLPAWCAAGDVRWTMLAATLALGLALRALAAGAALPAIVEDAPALVVWLAPPLYFFLEQAWIDVVPLAFLALALLLHERRRALPAAALFGLALSAKQPLLLAALPAARLLRPTRAQALVAAGVLVATVAPFALWHPLAFKAAVIDYQGALPPRADGLTFTNLAAHHVGPLPGFVAGGGLGFVVAGLIAVAGTFGLRPGAASFSALLAAVYFAFFALNKWAFANYYFFVGGLLALAVACGLRARAPS